VTVLALWSDRQMMKGSPDKPQEKDL